MNAESNRLFQRAILSSGTATYNWSMVTPVEQQRRVAGILDLLKCPPGLSKEETLTFLQGVEPDTYAGLMTKLKYFSKFPMPVNNFCLNRDSRKPVDRKPVLLGTTAEEGNIFPDQFYPANERPPQMTWLERPQKPQISTFISTNMNCDNGKTFIKVFQERTLTLICYSYLAINSKYMNTVKQRLTFV